MEVILLVVGAVLGVFADRLWERFFGKQHGLQVLIESDVTDRDSTETIIRVVNSGDYFERDIQVHIETAFGLDDTVRFRLVMIDLDSNRQWERLDSRSQNEHFNIATMTVKVDGMDPGEEVLVVAVSKDYIPTLRVDAISNETSCRYNSFNGAPAPLYLSPR